MLSIPASPNLGLPSVLLPSPEARATSTHTHTPLTPLPSSLFSLCSLGPGPTLCSPLLPATGSPCGFSFPETLPFSGLRALPGQGPRAGLRPGHWKVWDVVQTQPPGGLVAPWLHLQWHLQSQVAGFGLSRLHGRDLG